MSGHLPIVDSVLSLWTSESKHPLRTVCLACGSHELELCWFLKLDVLGAHLLSAGLKTQVPHVGFKPFAPQGETPGFELFPIPSCFTDRVYSEIVSLLASMWTSSSPDS